MGQPQDMPNSEIAGLLANSREVADGVAEQAYRMIVALNLRRYPDWIIALDGKLPPEQQYLEFRARYYAFVAQLGFFSFLRLAANQAGFFECPNGSDANEATAAGRDIYAIVAEGRKLMREGLVRRRELMGMAGRDAAHEKATQYFASHQAELARLNESMAALGERMVYFADSDDPSYAGWCCHVCHRSPAFEAIRRWQRR